MPCFFLVLCVSTHEVALRFLELSSLPALRAQKAIQEAVRDTSPYGLYSSFAVLLVNSDGFWTLVIVFCKNYYFSSSSFILALV